MNEQEMMAFMEWIPGAVAQLQDQLPQEFVQAVSQAQSVEDIDGILTEMAQSDEGSQLINALYQAFQQSNAQQSSLMASMKKGGKIDYFVNCFAKGGSVNCNCNKPVKAFEPGGKNTGAKYNRIWRKNSDGSSSSIETLVNGDRATERTITDRRGQRDTSFRHGTVIDGKADFSGEQISMTADEKKSLNREFDSKKPKKKPTR